MRFILVSTVFLISFLAFEAMAQTNTFDKFYDRLRMSIMTSDTYVTLTYLGRIEACRQLDPKKVEIYDLEAKKASSLLRRDGEKIFTKIVGELEAEDIQLSKREKTIMRAAIGAQTYWVINASQSKMIFSAKYLQDRFGSSRALRLCRSIPSIYEQDLKQAGEDLDILNRLGSIKK